MKTHFPPLKQKTEERRGDTFADKTDGIYSVYDGSRSGGSVPGGPERKLLGAIAFRGLFWGHTCRRTD